MGPAVRGARGVAHPHGGPWVQGPPCVCVKAGGYRYWPVLATVSMERPASEPLVPETSVRM